MSGLMTQPLANDVRAENGDRRHAGGHIERPDELGREQYSISDLTSEFGCTARALRFYEDEGLIAPSRIGLTRIYSKRDRARLAWSMRAKNVGFSLTAIREMNDLYAVPYTQLTRPTNREVETTVGAGPIKQKTQNHTANMCPQRI